MKKRIFATIIAFVVVFAFSTKSTAAAHFDSIDMWLDAMLSYENLCETDIEVMRQRVLDMLDNPSSEHLPALLSNYLFDVTIGDSVDYLELVLIFWCQCPNCIAIDAQIIFNVFINTENENGYNNGNGNGNGGDNPTGNGNGDDNPTGSGNGDDNPTGSGNGNGDDNPTGNGDNQQQDFIFDADVPLASGVVYADDLPDADQNEMLNGLGLDEEYWDWVFDSSTPLGVFDAAVPLGAFTAPHGLDYLPETGEASVSIVLTISGMLLAGMGLYLGKSQSQSQSRKAR